MQPTSILIPATKRLKHLPRRWSVGRRETRDEVCLDVLLGGGGAGAGAGGLGWEQQQLLENFEGVGAVAAASDLESGGTEFGVFLGEVWDAGKEGEGQGCQGFVYFCW